MYLSTNINEIISITAVSFYYSSSDSLTSVRNKTIIRRRFIHLLTTYDVYIGSILALMT